MQDVEQTEQELTALIVRIMQHHPEIPDEWQRRYPPGFDHFDRPYQAQPETEQLILALKQHGFGFLGAGCFGLVLCHESTPDTAYKISARLNDAYGAFALYSRQMQGDPHLPVIREIQTGAFFMVVALEMLERISHENGWVCSEASRVATAESRMEAYTMSEDFEDFAEFLDCAAGIGRYFAGVAQIDIHDENIMQRADGTLVITDPVSYTKG